MLPFEEPQDSIKQVIGWIEGWILKNQQKVIQAFLEKGGWEGWAQVELAEVLRQLPQGPTVQREHPIYDNSREAVDFYISWAYNAHPPLCIELKCESLWQSAKQGRQYIEHVFYKEIQDDIEKLQSSRKFAYSGQAAYVVAITVSELAAQGLRERLAPEEETLDVGEYNIRVFWIRV